ncbi:hypothetical protein ACHAXH_001423, partial [Discostella pseudostelligera]
LYTDLRVTLKIGKETTDIEQTVGVRQGDNLSPVIFLFVMTAFSEILNKKLILAGIPRVEATHTPLSELSNGQLTGQTNPTRKQGSTTYITQTPFHTKKDAIQGTILVKETFSSLGLEMHCGSNDNKKSKTKILWIPPPSFYSTTTNQANQINQTNYTPDITQHSLLPTETTSTNPSLDTNDDDHEPIMNEQLSTTRTERPKCALTFSTMTPKQREELYWKTPVTNRIDFNSKMTTNQTSKYAKASMTYQMQKPHSTPDRQPT